MTQELTQHIRALSRLIYFVTDEEDIFLKKLRNNILNKKYAPRTFVFNHTLGLTPIDDYIADWTAHKHPVKQLDLNSVFTEIYKEDTANDQNFYVFLDPDRIFKDEQLVRRILNIVHSLHNDVETMKVLIFVGPRRAIPEKLSRYMEVVHDTGLTDEEIQALIDNACANMAEADIKVQVPSNALDLLRGMTDWEVQAAISQSITHTKRDKNPDNRFRIDPDIITTYRRRALKKTDLLQYVDTSEFTFDQVGGAQRFKAWAQETAPSWTKEGRTYGLKPPKGILAVGVWGCGKSLSVKAMGSAWNLPVIQLETGKLRSSQQGASEANVYHAIHLIERVAGSSGVILWCDEAEKSLSGGKSSDQTDSGTTSRMIGILSTWLQETKAPICLALTANSLASLPIEFINRVDERFFFDMPSKSDRIEILKIHLAAVNQDPKKFDLNSLATAAEGMVGREIEQAIKAAMTLSFHAKLPSLGFDILRNTLIKKPRLSKTMADEVKQLVDWVGYDEESDDGIRARFASNPPAKNKGSTLQVVGG